jgi:hypothetical protein
MRIPQDVRLGMSSQCQNCGNFKCFDDLFECNDDVIEKDLNYFHWETIKFRIVKIEKSGTVQDAINELKNQTANFLMHSFITHVQHIHFEEYKENVSPSSIVLQVYFSENYRTVYQDEIQNAFFNHNQSGLFTGVIWSSPDSEVISYTIVSDDISQDKYLIHACLTEIITNLNKRFSSLKTVNIFSDGAVSQFEQRFSFANLTFLSNDYDLNLIQNFFSSGHGCGAVDGVGGNVTRLVWKGVMANQCVTRSAPYFVCYTTAVAKSMNIILMDAEHIKSQSLLLDQRWKKVRPIPNQLC